MNCIHCNKDISNDSKFCPYCGKENTQSNHLKNKFQNPVLEFKPIDVNLQYINGESDVFFNNPSRGYKDKYYVIPVTLE